MNKMRFSVTWKIAPYIVLMTLSLAPTQLVNTINGYLPFLALLCSALASLIHLLIIRTRVHFSANTGKTACVRGDTIDFSIRVKNSSILPVPGLKAEICLLDMDGRDCQTLPLFLTISPGHTRDFNLSADFKHIGAYRVGIRKLAVYDLFGLFRATKHDEYICRADILPRLYPLRSLPVTSALQSESSRAVNAVELSGSDYIGVREYAIGDPIKMIHWKLSAHAMGLMTKQTESYTNTGLSVVLDFHIPDYNEDTRLQMFDGIVEAGVAMGDHATQNGMDYDLRYISRSGEKRMSTPQSFHHFTEAVTHMRVFSPGEQTELLSDMLREECSTAYAQANIALCTSFLSDALILSLLHLKRSGKNAILCYLLPDDLDPNARAEALSPLKQLQYAHIPCLVVSSAEKLETII